MDTEALDMTVYVELSAGWPRTFCRTDQRVMMCCEVKGLRSAAAAKASLKWANIVACHRPETG